MSEALQVEAGRKDVSARKYADAQEVINYRNALAFAAEQIREQPLSWHLLRQAHALLLSGVRGERKSPGAFRSQQNWIGSAGGNIEQANFIPIAQEHLQSGIDKWSKYAALDDEDPLVQLALIHLEFEALHPFEDGNGRLGRMIIPLFLFNKGIISEPSFYMSGYLEACRDQYVETMRNVSARGDWTGWIAFFLQAVAEQAKANQERAQAMLTLYHEMPTRISELTHSQYAPQTNEFIFKQPIFRSVDFFAGAGIPKPTAQRILRVLRDLRIIATLAGGRGRGRGRGRRRRRHPASYAFRELINVAEQQEIV